MKEQIINWTKNIVTKTIGNDDTKVVIGISGGKDSTVVAKVLVDALGADKVIGVMMPNGEQKDIDDSIEVIKYLNLPIKNIYNINIGDIYNTMTQLCVQDKTPTNKFATNTPARIRMTVLYSLAAEIGNAIVVNTSNKSEKLCGWGTLWGDTVGDFSPLGDLLVSQVIQLGKELGIPDWMVEKAPSDGMTGKTDEDNLGFTYDELEKYYYHKLDRNDPHYPAIRQRLINFVWKRDFIRIPTFFY